MVEEEKDSLLSNEDDEPSLKQKTVELKVYPQRWLMLFIFSMTTLLNGSMFMGLSSVVEVVAPYYGVSAVHIEWLSNMFMVVFIFVAMPSAYIMSLFGVRTVLTLAAGLAAAATAIQFAGAHQDKFQFVLIGQFFAAIAYGNMIQIPGKLSATWFPPRERGMSTSIGVFMNILGVAVGFVQPSYQIPVSYDPPVVYIGLKHFYTARMLMAFIIFFLTVVFYREKPPTPVSVIEGKKHLEFFDSLKVLYKDFHFHLMAQAYGIYFGLFVAVSVVFSPLVSWQYGSKGDIQHLIGWMGFTCDIAAIISCLAIGFFLDRYSHHKAVAIFLNAGSMLLWLLFALILTQTKNFNLLFFVYVVYGTVGIPYFASGVEQAAEMTSPVPEGTSSTVILLLGNIYGFVMIFTFGAMIEDGYPLTTLYLILGLYVLSTAFVTFSKMELKRSEAESTTSTISIGDDEEDSDEKPKLNDSR
ncbi:heme transporter FLVCR2-like [Clytia hemisphaerica]|uniref:heme transporter FLVCR2-like n=1 Tax=Clytia hemisphaerica TaxID=252671 RepID=UPI0034D49AED